MNTYNQDIVTVIKEFVSRVMNTLNSTNNNGITDPELNLSWTEDTAISNYLSHGVDSYFIFSYTYKFNGENFAFELRVPREVAGVFVVNSKVAIPYMELVTDFRMKLHKGVLKIDNKRSVHQNKDGLTLEVDGMSFNLSDPTQYSQIPDQYLELSDELKKIAMAKTMRMPEKLDAQICKDLIVYGENQGKLSDISDVTIKSTAEYIRGRLNHDFSSFMNDIRYRFKGGNRSTIGAIYVGRINKSIYQYFSTNSGKFNYFTNVTNPLTLQSLSTQVKVPYKMSFNASVFDLIDVVDTPINNHINKINYLNRNVNLTEGGIKLEVWTKDHKRVWIEKLDYCINAILNSDCWDYHRWEVKSEYKGKELLAKIGKYNLLVDSLDDVAYIELDPNERVSVTSRVIPMVNKSELGRMAMGTSMVKQGVNLINAEEPLVTTSDLSDLIKLNPLIITSTESGEVISVTRTTVTIKGKSGPKSYNIPYALQSNTGNLVPFIPVVEVGQKVDEGDIIISPSNLGKNAIKYGINAIAAFNAYFGFNSDDAIVISESFADRIASVYTHKQVISIKNIESLRYIKPAGSKISSGDVLVDFTVIPKKSKYGDMLNKPVEVENILHKTAMNNLMDAFIFEIKVSMGKDVYLDDESMGILDSLNKDIDLSEYKGEIPLLPESELEVTDNEIKIEFSLLMRRKAYVGDKLTNRYGNKGVIAKIVPDNEMIQTEDGLVADVCFSRESLPARKNISQIYELYLGQISNKIESIWNKGTDEDKIKAVGVYNTLYKTEYSYDEFTEQVKKYGKLAFAAKVGTYSDVKADEVIDAINALGVHIKNKAKIKGRKLATEVLFGPMYIIKLPYLPENSLAVTTSKKLLGSLGPQAGLGKTRGEGQKLGEMESTAALANSPELLNYYKSLGGVESNLNRLYFDMLDLGLDISGIATKVIEDKNNLSEDDLKKLIDKYQ